MGVVVGFVIAGKRHHRRRCRRNRCRFFVARASGRHRHAHEHRSEGRCLVVAPGGTVPVPDPPPVSLARPPYERLAALATYARFVAEAAASLLAAAALAASARLAALTLASTVRRAAIVVRARLAAEAAA
jgi:hypothetical protein